MISNTTNNEFLQETANSGEHDQQIMYTMKKGDKIPKVRKERIPKEPKKQKMPKALKTPKAPKAPKTPKTPKALKIPKTPKALKTPKPKKAEKSVKLVSVADDDDTDPLTKSNNDSVIPKDVLDNKATEVGWFWSVEKPLTPDAIDLLKKLCPFFTYENMEKLIVPRSIKSLGLAKQYHMPDCMKEDINGISLRAIEWLVTNYSKGTKIVLFHEELKRRVDIHRAYENHSSYFKRNLFDPFCRHDKIYFFWKLRCIKTNELKDVVLLTTVGQLNFMKWAHEHGVLAYAKQHQVAIQTDMEQTLSVVNKEKKQYKAAGQRRKRKELTKAPNFCCTVYSIPNVLHFDHFDSPATSPELGPASKKLCFEKQGDEKRDDDETFHLDNSDNINTSITTNADNLARCPLVDISNDTINNLVNEQSGNYNDDISLHTPFDLNNDNGVIITLL